MTKYYHLIVLLTFMISTNFLYAIGVPYNSPNAGPLIKIHISTYVLALFAIIILAEGKNPPDNSRKYFYSGAIMTMSSIIVLCFHVMLSKESGGEISGLIVTYITAGFILICFAYANESTIASVRSLLSLLFIVNSIIAIYENMSGDRILPYMAGDVLIDYDRRSTALVGHPLSNSLLTGSWFLIVFMNSLRDGTTIRASLVMLLHCGAMLSFGGRSALVLLFIFCGFYACYLAISVATLRKGAAVIRRLFLYIVTSIAAVPLIVYSGVADYTFSRFLDGRGSDETRSAAVEMMYMLSEDEWFTGAPLSTRTWLMQSTGSERGIELSWVALLIIYGFPLALLILLTMVFTLFWVVRGRGIQGFILVLYFLTTTFTSMSIASKTLILAQFLILIICSTKPSLNKRES